MAEQIYQLADVAAILRMKKSRAKNWTIGRPFSVRPSVLSSSGKGSRNLFSRNDVNRFALVERFHEVGAPALAIQQLLNELSQELVKDSVWMMTEGKHRWAVISREEPSLLPYTVYLAVSFPDILPRQERDIASLTSTFCFYAVSLSGIASSVSHKIYSLKHEKPMAVKRQNASRRAKRVRGRK